MNVFDDNLLRVVVEQHATGRRHEHALRVLGVVEPDAVLVIQGTSYPAAVQLTPTFNDV